jgi:glycosyltransferase involved in cell wall biosynthesis
MISVALASYNGEKFIREQIDSILRQIGERDELIISDNMSRDNTIDVIKGINDKRIKLCFCEKEGVVANFENALNHTLGDIIFLSDQDDIWVEGKVEKIVSIMTFEEPQLIYSNLEFVDGAGCVLGVHWKLKRGYVRNLIKGSYVGATFAFNRKFMEKALPFPDDIPMHDWYMGLFAEKMKYKITLLNEKLIYYRRHEQTLTGCKNPLSKKLRARLSMNRAVCCAARRMGTSPVV